LYLALTEADLEFEQVVLVLEGRARFEPRVEGVPASGHPQVTVVNAPASGDDAVVGQVVAAEPPVVVVTSDRGLRSRVAVAGAECVGPSWLLEQVSYPRP
jgi:hypothetical protein